ncbi:MAG: hypothetical protein M0031_09735 [Thermaerobacter sp.]|nr:hypothetical protein [Thermaerobacter sp.]
MMRWVECEECLALERFPLQQGQQVDKFRINRLRSFHNGAPMPLTVCLVAEGTDAKVQALQVERGTGEDDLRELAALGPYTVRHGRRSLRLPPIYETVEDCADHDVYLCYPAPKEASIAAQQEASAPKVLPTNWRKLEGLRRKLVAASADHVRVLFSTFGQWREHFSALPGAAVPGNFTAYLRLARETARYLAYHGITQEIRLVDVELARSRLAARGEDPATADWRRIVEEFPPVPPVVFERISGDEAAKEAPEVFITAHSATPWEGEEAFADYFGIAYLDRGIVVGTEVAYVLTKEGTDLFTNHVMGAASLHRRVQFQEQVAGVEFSEDGQGLLVRGPDGLPTVAAGAGSVPGGAIRGGRP